MRRPDDGSDPAAHSWRIAPNRRNLLGFAGWVGVLGSIGVGAVALVRFMYPRVLFEPPLRVKLGRPSDYAPESVSEKWLGSHRLWLLRFRDRFVALSATCTHLGCTPRYLASEDRFRCPCHGSGFRGFASGPESAGAVFEGPAPRPLERFAIALEDGEIVVDKSKIFRLERREAELPGAFLPYA